MEAINRKANYVCLCLDMQLCVSLCAACMSSRKQGSYLLVAVVGSFQRPTITLPSSPHTSIYFIAGAEKGSKYEVLKCTNILPSI